MVPIEWCERRQQRLAVAQLLVYVAGMSAQIGTDQWGLEELRLLDVLKNRVDKRLPWRNCRRGSDRTTA